MQEYQTRVIEEKEQLDSRLKRLYEFINSDRFSKLTVGEQGRMNHQHVVMREYSARIKAFV
jgi:hypothetical protein